MYKAVTAPLENKDEENFTEALREVRAQMEPMQEEVLKLRERDSIDIENLVREKTSLNIRLIELEANSERKALSLKNMEKKVVELSEEVRQSNDQLKHLKEVEEENKILGGKLIVL